MKIIEAMKKIKDLQKKAADTRAKILLYHADADFEVPTYGTVDSQKEQISNWLQSHSDIIKEICKLRSSIQKTNCLTKLKVEFSNGVVEKTLAEWIHRRRDLAKLEFDCWAQLGDRGLLERGQIKKTTGEVLDFKIRRYYDPRKRDEMKELYTSEPFVIDGALEVSNAVTDLIDI